jgi:pimeloyl-ACP methyl ester carboxylesterase
MNTCIRNPHRPAIYAIALLTCFVGAAVAGEPFPVAPKSDVALAGSPTTGLAAKTLGGVQFWGDELFFHEWRIQRNTLTGHCRLLDGDDRRFAWGSFEQCQAKLEEIKSERKLPPMHGRAVILLHGLGAFRATMTPLADYLAADGDVTIINVSYPSTRGGIKDHAQALGCIVKHLDGIDTIDFVGHSLGNLVIRHFLGDITDPATGVHADSRIRRFVMIGPPNHGAEKAEKWSDSGLFQTMLGTSAVQLGAGWPDVEPHLAIPACEFGIIAGGKGDHDGFTSSIDGDALRPRSDALYGAIFQTGLLRLA